MANGVTEDERLLSIEAYLWGRLKVAWRFPKDFLIARKIAKEKGH